MWAIRESPLRGGLGGGWAREGTLCRTGSVEGALLDVEADIGAGPGLADVDRPKDQVGVAQPDQVQRDVHLLLQLRQSLANARRAAFGRPAVPAR